MKKLKILILLALLFPISVNAGVTPKSGLEETYDRNITSYNYCNVVSGNGSDIGSEIECNGEHFYVIGKNSEYIRLLSKYNLYVGFDVYKLTFTESRYNELKELYNAHDPLYSQWWSNDILSEPEFTMYSEVLGSDDETHTMLVKKDQGSTTKFASNDTYPKQSSIAISAHSGKIGEPEFPQYGNLNVANTYTSFEDEAYGNEHFIDGDPIMFNDILDAYADYFYENNIKIVDRDMMSIKELSSIVNNITGKPIPLEKWYQNKTPVEVKLGKTAIDKIFVLGDLKTVVPDNYNWLYSTTYWTKTLDTEDTQFLYFIDTLGYVCSQTYCQSALGAGLRPIIVLDNTAIKYPIFTNIKGEGSINVVESSAPGDLIKFTLKANNRLRLNKINVTTASGNIIELSDDDITQTDDYMISVSSKKFIMPTEAVTISAEWINIPTKVEENPNTGLTNYILIFSPIAIILLLINGLLKRKKSFKFNK